MKQYFIVSILMSLAFLGCADGDLPVYYKLGTLRILAIKADSPEVSPGATVLLTPLVSDLDGLGRTLTYQAQACVDPGVAIGADPDCSKDPAVQNFSGTFAPKAPAYTGQAAPFSVSIPLTVLLGRAASDQRNGVPFLVTYSLTTPSGESVKSFKRITVSAPSKLTKNLNPEIASVHLASNSETALTQLPDAEQDLFPYLTQGVEKYTAYTVSENPLVLGNPVEKEEDLTVTWFISQGEMKLSRTGEDALVNRYTPASPVVSSVPEIMVVVVHDNRGGVSYVGVPGL